MSIYEEFAETIVQNIECMYTILAQNRLYKRHEFFYCYLCKLEIKNLLGAFCHATRDKEHNQRNKMCYISNDKIEHFQLDEEESFEMVYNGIVALRLPEIFCTICSCEIASLDSMTDHVNKTKHLQKKRLNQDSCSSSSLITNSCSNPKNVNNNSCNTPGKSDDNNCSNLRNSNDNSCSTPINSKGNNYNNPNNSKTENRVKYEIKNNKSKQQTKNIDSLPKTANKEFITKCSENKKDEINEDDPLIIYACDLCKIQLPIKNVVKYHRMFHISDENYLSKNLDIIKFRFKNKNEKDIYCLICNKVINSEIELHSHLEDINHVKKVLVLRRNYNLTNISTLQGCQDQLTESKIVKEILFYCQVCQVSMPYSENSDSYKNHAKGTSHVENVQKLGKNKDFTLKSISSDSPILKCFLCDVEYNEEKELWHHYNTDLHLRLMEAINRILQEKNIFFISNNRESVLHCTACEIKTCDVGGMINHINLGSHKKEKHNVIQPDSLSPNNSTVLLLELEQDKAEMQMIGDRKSSIFYYCPTCNVKENEDFVIIQHLKSANHSMFNEERKRDEELINVQFSCPICITTFNDDGLFMTHLQSVGHTLRKYSLLSQNFGKNFESNYSTINQTMNGCILIDDSKVENTWPTGSIKSDTMDEILHDLIDLEPTEIPTKLNSKLDLLDNNFSVNSKDLLDVGEKFISLCIEPGSENIFSVDLNKLKKLQLGVSVTFPKGVSKRFCIPCSTEISIDSELFDQHLCSEYHLQNIEQLKERHKITKECVSNRLTDLDLSRSFMKFISDDWDYYIRCFACNIRVEYCDAENHICSQSHAKNITIWKKSAEDIFEEKKIVYCEAWYYAEKFICDICSLKFYSDINFADHLIKEEHLFKVHKESCNTDLEYNICGYCLTFWFGKTNGYLKHCEGDFHKYLIQTNSYAIAKLHVTVQDILSNYEKTIKELLETCDNSDKNVEEDLLQSILKVARECYPSAEAFMYGSRKSLTNLNDSDLDIFVDCISSYSSMMTAEKNATYLKNIRKCLKKFEDIWIVEDTILQTKVPIIKLRHIKTKINCDISCTNGLGVEKSKLIRCYVEAFPPCRKLVLFLKKWMHLCRLSGIKGINSFSTSCLVIYYLQVKGILPSVYNLIKLENKSNIVAGWETGFLKKIPLQISSGKAQLLLDMSDGESTEIFYPMKDLLIGFFSFYSNFNYITDVICPYLGKIIKKKEFIDMDALRDEMKIYKTLYEKKEADIFRFDSPMCVQDPIDLSKNITKSVTKLQLRTFKKYCYESLLLLNAATIKVSQGQ